MLKARASVFGNGLILAGETGLLVAGSGTATLPVWMPARQRPPAGMARTFRKGAVISSSELGGNSAAASGLARVDDLADASGGGEIVAASQEKAGRAVAADAADVLVSHRVGQVLH